MVCIRVLLIAVIAVIAVIDFIYCVCIVLQYTLQSRIKFSVTMVIIRNILSHVISSDLIGHSPPSRGWLCPGHERHPGPVPSGDRLGG